jgi:prepilin-type processing-associated H-X9-DG protein
LPKKEFNVMPVNFTCPHCGATTEVADQYAGQSGPCAHCGKMVTVPLPGGMSPPTDVGRPVMQGMGTGAIVAIVLVVVLLVALVCGGVLAGLLLPAVQAAREAARRAQCSNNLKQISLALLQYEQAHGCFPPAYIPDKNGKPMHSWRVLILPYMEEKGLYDQYRFDEPWDGPHNKTLAFQMPRVYACPTGASPGGVMTSYAMLVGPHAFSTGPKGRKISEIIDGTSNTIMVAETANLGVNWMQPQDLDVGQMRLAVNGGRSKGSTRGTEISSSHPGGAYVAFCDGSVQLLSDTVDGKTLKRLTTIDDGEAIDPRSF